MTGLGAQIRMEVRRVYRNRRYLLFTILLPITFYLFFVALFGEADVPGLGPARAFLLVSTTAYGVMAATLVTFAGRVASERKRGWFSLLRTTPVTMTVVLLAKVVASLVASLGVVIVMLTLGAALNGPGFLSPGAWIGLAAALVLGAVPFTALALVVGYLFDAETAWSASLWVYFALAMIGGIFTPVETMPETLRTVAVFTPAYRYAKVGWNIVTGREQRAEDALWLVGYLTAFALLAAWAYRRDEVARYR